MGDCGTSVGWDRAAPAWEHHHSQLAAHTRPVSERMIQLLDPTPGEQILELAAGTGELAEQLAPRLGGDGTMICSDIAPQMVDAARRRIASDRIRFATYDAHDLPLADGTVDGVVCKMGLMLMPDPQRVASETRRVLGSEGRLVAATWGPLEQNLWLAIFGAAMLTHGHQPPDTDEPGGVFSLDTPEALRELLTEAGFHDVHVETINVPDRHDTFQNYWNLRAGTSGPLTDILRGLPEDQIETIRSTCAEFAAEHEQPDGSYHFPGQALIARAR